MTTLSNRQPRSRRARNLNGVDLRKRYPVFVPPNGWHESRPRHPDGWIPLLVDDIVRNGGSAHFDDDSALFDDGRTSVLVIGTLYPDWGAFGEPLRVELCESSLEDHLRRMIKPDGTVHGLRDPDEPVETDGMMAAYNLFTIHLAEELNTSDGLASHQLVLTPGTGLQSR